MGEPRVAKLNRRDFIRGAIGLGLWGGSSLWLAGCGATPKTASVPGFFPLYLRQIITADAANSRVVQWQLTGETDGQILEYRLKGREEILSAPALNETFTDDGATNYQYTATLTDLTPSSVYEYRVRDGEVFSPWHDLSTPDNGEFSCLIFPDSQSSDYHDWRELAQKAAARHGEASFFVNMGDIVDNGEDKGQWRAWLDAVEGIIDRMPFVPVMGNHETYDENWKVRLPVAYLNYFHAPDNDSEVFARYYYSFDYGAVHFVVLNTQWEETEEFSPGLKEAQIAWLREDVRQSKTPWKIALLHKDVLQYRIHNRPERLEGISDIGEVFMPLFDELNFDIVFTAHLHTYRDRGHIYNFRRDTQGALYILTGVAGNVRYPGLWVDHALDEKVAPQPETDNYLTLTASPEKLTVVCYLPDGSEIDRAEVFRKEVDSLG
ncbi:MAG: metallophosphoesterase family protein [Selenomonadaceae bacterium]|nr:metallophosphoesterase family protein [Selenomonadaceae bacterium]